MRRRLLRPARRGSAGAKSAGEGLRDFGHRAGQYPALRRVVGGLVLRNDMLKYLAVLALVALSACGSRPETAARVSPVTRPAILNPAFADSDPYPWMARRPTNHPVHGIDTSRWQGAVDWATARQAGVSFAFMKATEGGDRVDPQFASQWAAAGAAGVPRGAYHFFYFCTPAAEQARWFIANVPREAGALPPVLDIEWTPFSPTCRIRPAPAVIRSEIGIFLQIVGRHYGQRPIVYTTPEFWQDNGFADISNEDFWLRSTNAHPSDAYAGMPWTFWQYTGTGRVPGVAGDVDINTFAGSAGAWQRWLAARTQ